MACLKRFRRELLGNTMNFLIFVIMSILGILAYYGFTRDEILPLIILCGLFVLFWKSTNFIGKLFLTIPTLFGFFHEILGTQLGWFQYTAGVLGAPFWLIPGYGTIFWTAYHLSELLENEKWFKHFRNLEMGFFISVLIVDLLLSRELYLTVLSLFGVFFIFYSFKNKKDTHFIFIIVLLCLFMEALGEFFGAWHHKIFLFSQLSLSYAVLAWILVQVRQSYFRKLNLKEWLIGLLGVGVWILASYAYSDIFTGFSNILL